MTEFVKVGVPVPDTYADIDPEVLYYNSRAAARGVQATVVDSYWVNGEYNVLVLIGHFVENNAKDRDNMYFWKPRTKGRRRTIEEDMPIVIDLLRAAGVQVADKLENMYNFNVRRVIRNGH